MSVKDWDKFIKEMTITRDGFLIPTLNITFNDETKCKVCDGKIMVEKKLLT